MTVEVQAAQHIYLPTVLAKFVLKWREEGLVFSLILTKFQPETALMDRQPSLPEILETVLSKLATSYIAQRRLIGFLEVPKAIFMLDPRTKNAIANVRLFLGLPVDSEFEIAEPAARPDSLDRMSRLQAFEDKQALRNTDPIRQFRKEAVRRARSSDEVKTKQAELNKLFAKEAALRERSRKAELSQLKSSEDTRRSAYRSQHRTTAEDVEELKSRTLYKTKVDEKKKAWSLEDSEEEAKKKRRSEELTAVILARLGREYKEEDDKEETEGWLAAYAALKWREFALRNSQDKKRIAWVLMQVGQFYEAAMLLPVVETSRPLTKISLKQRDGDWVLIYQRTPYN